jgi:hypothetical protein
MPESGLVSLLDSISDNGGSQHCQLSMTATLPSNLSEIAQLLLGAFALADAHTLTAAQVAEMSNNVIAIDKAEDAFSELAEAQLAETLRLDEITAYRLSKAGLEVSLELQTALAQRTQG